MRALIAPVGIGVIEGIQQIPSPNGTVEIIKLALQVILAIGGLIKMFKKPKPQQTNQNTNN